MRRVLWVLVFAVACAGCYRVRSSAGGGDVKNPGPRTYNAADIALPDGYRAELVTSGLSLPTGITFDASGNAYVIEGGYSYGELFAKPRLLRVGKDGATSVVFEGNNPPWTGVTFHDGAFLISEGGVQQGGRIIRVTPEGERRVLVENLPTLGDHHTNGPVVGPDGFIYFGVGTATNAGFVGADNAEFGWLARHPQFHDVPCKDVTLAGNNINGTGAYLPHQTASTAGQVIKGAVPCSGAVLKISKEGGAAELVAWGFRNPFGVAFHPDGSLYVTDNAYDVRGSRPVFGAGDLLWKATAGMWHGWPDYAEGILAADRRFRAEGKDVPVKVLQPGTEPNEATKPAAIFGVHSSANGFDFSRSEAFGHQGQAFVALFGDMGPKTGKLVGPVGFKVVRVEVTTGVIEDFAVNRSRVNGPASLRGLGGLERPVAARFDPQGNALYVVDFGVMTMDGEGPKPQLGTGSVWRITREVSR